MSTAVKPGVEVDPELQAFLSMLDEVPEGDCNRILNKVLDESKVLQLDDAACNLFFNEDCNGGNQGNIRALKECCGKGWNVKAGSRDRGEWLTGIVHTPKGLVVFG